MKKLLILAITLAFTQITYAQVGYGTNNPDPRSVVELQSTDKALYLPRLTDAQITAQSDWKEGMIVYNTDKKCLYKRNDTEWVCLYGNNWFGTDNNAAATENTEDIYVMSDKLGINTSSPQKTLHVQGDARMTDLPVGAINIINFAEDSIVTIDDNGDLRQVSPISLIKEPWFGVDDSTHADLNTEDIYHSGKVGIAEIDPKAELHVLGDVRIDGASILSFDTTASILGATSWGNVLYTDGYTNIGLLSISPGGPNIVGDPIISYESGANTTTTGIVEKGNNLIGDVRESFWVYLVNGGWLKAIKLEFRLDNDTIQARYLDHRYRAITPVTTDRQTPSWFEGSGWNYYVYDLSELRLEYDSVSAGNTTVYVTDSSNVGIGLSFGGTPSQRLDVRGSARIDEFIYDENNEKGSTGQILSTSATGIDWVDASGDAWGVTGEDQTSTIGRTGNVGIGTTSPTQKLSVNGTAGKTGGGSWATFSDKRVKTDIQPYAKGLSEIVNIRPVTFKYNAKSGYEDTSSDYVGIIAQEIEKVLPSTVSHYDDSQGPSGLSDKREFDSSELIWTVINAIKELKAENDKLKTLLKEQGIRVE
jgi:hypothetical protein